jgi:DNA-binding MarR family transcriptional regulator
MLEAEMQAKIFSLYWNEKKSVRRIAELLGIDRKTVKRIIDRKNVILERERVNRTSLLDPHRERIKEMLVKDPTMASTTIMHRLREFGYMGGLSILKEMVRETKMKSPKVREAFLRLEFAPAECAQVDWRRH